MRGGWLWATRRRQAMAGAVVEFMDGVWRDRARVVAHYSEANATLHLREGLLHAGEATPVAAEQEPDLVGRASGVANTSFVRVFREAASPTSLVLGWAAAQDAREYAVRERHSAVTDQIEMGSNLALLPWNAVAVVGSAGSAERGCKGLEPRVSVAHVPTVASHTKTVASGDGVEWGAVGAEGGLDMVCYEATGLEEGFVYEFQVGAVPLSSRAARQN